MAPNGKSPTIVTTIEEILSEGEKDDVEQAAKEIENEKEAKKRRERRAETKYGGLIEANDDE